NHVLPKSSDPDEIAFRQKSPGLDKLRKQHIGLSMAKQLIFWPSFQEEEPEDEQKSRTYVNNMVAISLFNTAAHAFEEEQEAGMRNVLRLPELAAEMDEDTWYESTEGLYAKMRGSLLGAEKASTNWMNFHRLGNEKRSTENATLFARRTGETALMLTSLGLTYDTQSSPYDMQKNAQVVSQQLLDQARTIHLITGVDSSLKHMAVDPVEKIFPKTNPKNSPSENVLEVLRQLQRDANE
ncbi:hypothetical protein HY312_02450, partial [Candidatus Saccharibacteria bacterium]|nr:hypothetical protein [Candidatus Saccharibacteria bacterium]